MKSFNLFFFILLGFQSYSQINFNEHTIIDSSFGIYMVESIFATDIDGDGDQDVLSASSSDNKIAWYENTDGLGSYGQQNVIYTGAIDPRSVYAADIDGDGDIDVLSASDDDDTIAWYENIDGKGNFSGQKIISNQANGARSVFAIDIDGDDDIDVLYGSAFKVVWLENIDGQGNFGDEISINTEAKFVTSVFAVDIDGDNDFDIISASSFDDKIAWYENINGLGNFSSQKIISTSVDNVKTVYSVDIDNDGDMDVLTAEGGFSNTNVYWFENIDGLGSFSTQKYIGKSAWGSDSVYAGDLDSDGDMDVLCDSNGIQWYENTDGKGNFILRDEMEEYYGSGDRIMAFDANSNGSLDILVGINNNILWFENTNGRGEYKNSNFITRDVNSLDHISFCDIDNDGDNDVVSNSLRGKITWHENNDSKGDFGIQNLISFDRSYENLAPKFSDIDGDGDIDIVKGIFGEEDILIWIENIEGKFNIVHNIPFTNDDISKSMKDIDINDFDNDGDIDIVLLYNGSSGIKLSYFENTDSKGTFSDEIYIEDGISGISNVKSIDFDGDNDIDILASTNSINNEFIIYENLDGNELFSEKQILAQIELPVDKFEVIDINGDEYLDIIYSLNNGAIYLLENTGDNSSFQESKRITGSVVNSVGYEMFDVNDIDNDGDIDIVNGSSEEANKLIWLENIDGKGNFGDEKTISTAFGNPIMSVIKDIDGDNDLDIIAGYWYRNENETTDYKLIWHENLLIENTLNITNFNEEISNYGIYPNPTSSNLNIESESKIYSLKVVNNLGQFILQEYGKNIIDVETFKNGLYFINIKDIFGNLEVRKFIKK